jgi:hypothetical protein
MQEWKERAETLEKQIENTLAQYYRACADTPWFGIKPRYPSNIYSLRSRRFEAMAEWASLENNVECRRFPDAKEVEKEYFCGEFDYKDPPR